MKDQDGSSRKKSGGARKARKARPPAPAPIEARFQAVFVSSRDAIGVSKAGVHVFVNPAYLELFGFPPGTDIAGVQVLDLIAPGSRDQIRAHIRRRVRGEPAPSTYETRGLRVDGSEFDMEVNVSRYQEDGEEQTLVILRDVTLRKQAEEALRNSKARLNTILDNIGAHIFIKDAGYRYTYANRKVCELFGRSVEEILGKSDQDFFSAASVEEIMRSDRPVIERGETIAREEVVLASAGKVPRTYWTVKLPLRDGTGTTTGLCGISTDITGLKRAEEVLRASEEKFRKVFLTSPDSININRLQDGMYISVNQGFTATTGYDAADVVGKTSLELNIWVDPAERQNLVEGLRRQGEVRNREARFRMKDGRIIDGLMSASIIEIDRVPHIVSVTRDITERKSSELALKQSEAKFRRLYNETPVLLHSIDRNGIVVEVNDYWLQTLGYRRSEVIGRKVTDFYTPASRAYAEKVVQPAFFRDGLARDIAYQFVRKDGAAVDVLLSATAERDDAGNVVRSLAVSVNVTEKKKAEKQLRESEERLDLALRAAHMGVWRWEIKENRRSFDDQACHLLGIEPATFTGSTAEFFKAVHPEDRGRIEAALARTREQDAPYESIYRVVWPDGSVHHITGRGRLVRDDKGQPARIDGILWDFTDQHLLEQERIKTQKLESVGTLAGGIAHDFNNLLQGIFGYISMARLTLDRKEKSLAMLEKAEKALHQAVNLTSQLLTFSKGGQPVKKVVDLRPLIENAAALALSGSRNTVEIVAERDLCAVEADEGQIGQVIQNIVLNADQAMPLGGLIRVAVRNMPAAAVVPPADLQGDLVEITIRDQGAGIPAEHLARIFDPYFTTKEKGSGLGLATAYSIVKNHGGLVRARSEVGTGTTFSLYLPASAAPAAGTVRPAIPAATREGLILVLDDEEMIRELASEMLTSLGHEVTAAETGESALETFRAARDAGRPFDLVILDLTIRGGMGGIETLQRLAAIDPDVKAVVSSGYSDDAGLSNYREQGFQAVLNKPYSRADLQRIVHSLLI